MTRLISFTKTWFFFSSLSFSGYKWPEKVHVIRWVKTFCRSAWKGGNTMTAIRRLSASCQEGFQWRAGGSAYTAHCGVCSADHATTAPLATQLSSSYALGCCLKLQGTEIARSPGIRCVSWPIWFAHSCPEKRPIADFPSLTGQLQVLNGIVLFHIWRLLTWREVKLFSNSDYWDPFHFQSILNSPEKQWIFPSTSKWQLTVSWRIQADFICLSINPGVSNQEI